MLSAENLRVIADDGRQILDLARGDPVRPVPQYPGWDMRALLDHMGGVYGRTVTICQEHPTERISPPALPDGSDPLDWYQENLDSMIAALADADPTTPVWSVGTEKTIGFWERRMVVETGLHRWDAGAAFGETLALSDHVARSALNEFVFMWLPRLGELPTLRVVAVDLGESWVFGDGEPADTVEGPASEIFLRLMSRPGVELPQSWAVAVDGLATPQGG